MHLPILYHWAPRERRIEILRQGLRPYSNSVSLVEDKKSIAFPYICLSPEPSTAWHLSGDMDWAEDIEQWDLWEVRLSRNDEVHFRSEWGDWIREIRVRNAIPADRVKWIAMREPLSALEGEEVK